jgi:hypothetical protein
MATAVKQQKVAAAPCTVDSKLYLLHPGEAATWLAGGMYERQRQMRPYHTAFLTHLMKTGKFRQGTPIDLAYTGGKRIVVNGQHTLHALVQSEVPQWVVLITHQPKTAEDLAHLYSTYDMQLPRNSRDMLRAYGFPAAAALNVRESTMLLGSMRLILSGFVHAMPRNDPRLAYLRDQELLYVAAMGWMEEARQFCAALRGVMHQWSKYLLRQPLMAIALVQFRYQPEKAQTFWDLVSRESHPEPSHVTRLYIRWLQREGLVSQFNRQEYLRITAAAWDAFFHERPLQRLVMQDAGKPLALAGTPHTLSSVKRYLTVAWELVQEPVLYAEPSYGSNA